MSRLNSGWLSARLRQCYTRCWCCLCRYNDKPDDYEVIGDMADRASSASSKHHAPPSDSLAKTDEHDGNIPQMGNLKLHPTGSFNSPKQPTRGDVARLNRRHSSPAITVSDQTDDMAPLRRKSQFAAVTFKKSDYPELAGIAEQSDEEARAAEASAASEWLGMLHFSIRTLPDLNRISVDLEKASDLPNRGTVGDYHSVVQLRLEPAEHTHVSKPARTRSPVFKESFCFDLAFAAQAPRVLVLTAFDSERRDQPVGHVTCQLFPEDKATELVRHYQKPLTRRSAVHDILGDLLISVTYVKSKLELNVAVLRGRDVKASHAAQEVYLKASMVCAGEKIKSKKSKPMPRTANPFFNHAFSFVVPSHYMDDVTMEVRLEARSVLKKARVLGRVVINPFTRHADHELCFWQRVLGQDAPCRKWFAMTL